MQAVTTNCDRCDIEICYGVNHTTVMRHTERFNRRGTVTVTEAEVILTLCLTCTNDRDWPWPDFRVEAKALEERG